jgi:hypothetical protein
VTGALLLLPGVGILAGGSALAIGQAVATDDDGYFTYTLDRVESDGVAIATNDLWDEHAADEDWPWALDWVDLDVRLRVTGAAATDDVFVGIARTADVERWLDGVAHSEVVDIDHRAPEYRQVAGATTLGSPLDEDFWVASASGSGEQEVTWAARGGRWSVVVANADGSPAVAADVQFGARSDAITPIAVTLIVLGGLTLTVAIALIVIGVRGRRTPPRPLASLDPPFPPPAPDTAVRPAAERETVG